MPVEDIQRDGNLSQITPKVSCISIMAIMDKWFSEEGIVTRDGGLHEESLGHARQYRLAKMLRKNQSIYCTKHGNVPLYCAIKRRSSLPLRS